MKNACGILGIIAGLLFSGSTGWASGSVAPFNLVIVVLDTSRSFQVPSHEPGVEGKVLMVEALRIVQQFFKEGANQRRRRTDGQDIYVLIGADAASQVIWSGTREQLAEFTPEVLAAAVAIRKQFALCTDLKAALNAAAGVLAEYPQASEAYVLTFSDLLHEPPRASWADCAPPSGTPPAGIAWETLSRAHLGFYYVSKDFRYRPDAQWSAELQRRGVKAVFLDAAQTLTQRVTLTPPAPAGYKASAGDIEAARGKLSEVGAFLRRAAMYGVGVVVFACGGLCAWILFARRRPGQEGRS
jgi:hypothetical protein